MRGQFLTSTKARTVLRNFQFVEDFFSFQRHDVDGVRAWCVALGESLEEQ